MASITPKIGIDLGTSRVRIGTVRKGIVLDEPAVVARDKETQKIIAVGEAAEEMVGKTPESIETDYPLKRGVIADFGAASKMLRLLLQSATSRLQLVKPDVMVSVSMTATSTEQRAVIDACLSAGAKNVYLIHSPIAAALGAHIPITEPNGNLIIDIGSGTTEIAVLSLGGVVSKRAIRTGSRAIDDSLIRNLKRSYGLSISRGEAERVKTKIGSVRENPGKKKLTVSGRSYVERLPKSTVLHSSDIQGFIAPVLDEILRAVRSVIEMSPPELVADIKQHGILVSGGGAKLTGLDKYFSTKLNCSVSVIDEPSLAVAKGSIIALKHVEDYKKSLLEV